MLTEVLDNQSKSERHSYSCDCSKCGKPVNKFVKVSERATFLCKDCKPEQEFNRNCLTCSTPFVGKGYRASYCSDCKEKRKRISLHKAAKKYKTEKCVCCGEDKITTLRKDEREDFLCYSCKHPKIKKECYFCNGEVLVSEWRKKHAKKAYHKECFGLESKAAILLKISRQAVNLAVNKEMEVGTSLISRKQALEIVLRKRNLIIDLSQLKETT